MGILICGLNGCGKSTLGRMLADRLSYTFIDNEDLYFPKTDNVYQFADPRSKEEVIKLLEKKVEADKRFVFAAVKGDYGDKLLNALDLVIYIEVPKEIRLERVRQRSVDKFGARVMPRGDLFRKENNWYALVESRPEDYTSKWLERIYCPVIKLDGTKSPEENLEILIAGM